VYKQQQTKKIRQAIADLSCAIKNLSSVTIERVWGWDEYTSEAHDRYRNALYDLLEIRSRIE
jgi:hypothetical protein